MAFDIPALAQVAVSDSSGQSLRVWHPHLARVQLTPELRPRALRVWCVVDRHGNIRQEGRLLVFLVDEQGNARVQNALLFGAGDMKSMPRVTIRVAVFGLGAKMKSSSRDSNFDWVADGLDSVLLIF